MSKQPPGEYAKLSIIQWTGKFGWQSGDNLPEAVYGKLSFSPDTDWGTPGGVAPLGRRQLATPQTYQPVILRIKGDGAVKGQIAFAADDWLPVAVAAPSDGTVLALTESLGSTKANLEFGLRRLCAQ